MQKMLLNFTMCFILFSVLGFARVNLSSISVGWQSGLNDNELFKNVKILSFGLTHGNSAFSFGDVAGARDVKGQSKNNLVLPWKRS